MILYRIRNRKTRKFFAGVRWHDGNEIWSDAGAFYRRPQTIKQHLTFLCSDRVTMLERLGTGGCTMQRHVVTKTHKSRLKNYQVIVDDVTLKGSKRIEADNFMKESHP